MLNVFILTYNRPDYLDQCLENLCLQTFQNFKIIVLDNGSDVSYDAVVKRHSIMGLEYIRHSENIQSTGNFMFAWKQASSAKYSMIFHDDDLMHPELLARQIAELEASPKLAWVGTGMLGFRQLPLLPPLKVDQPYEHIDAVMLADKLIGGFPLTFSSIVYRTCFMPRIDIDYLVSRCSIVFDRPLLLKLADIGGCAITHAPLVYYRIHPAQDSKNGPLKEDQLLNLCDYYREIVWQKGGGNLQQRFYRWTAYQIPDGWTRLNYAQRSSANFQVYLLKARDRGLLRLSYVCLYYPSGHLSYFFNRAVRAAIRTRNWLAGREF
jgi:glycosyltransferase involved in cell wall biosynthesis